MNYSLFFPVNIRTPFEIGSNHIKEGMANVKNGNPHGLLKVALGILEWVPFFNYPIAICERKFKLSRGTEWKVRERQKELAKEIESESIVLQQLYFETHNSALKGRSENFQEISKVLDYSYPDRELAICIKNLESFGSDQENERIKNTLLLLRKMELIYSTLTCLLLEPSENGRKELSDLLINLIVEQVGSLSVNQSMLVPIGNIEGDVYDLSKNGINAHIALLKITRIDEKNCEAIIFNSRQEFGEKHIQKHKGKILYPWITFSTYSELCKRSFWKELILKLVGKNSSTSYAYDQLEQIASKEVIQDTAVHKGYRTQILQNCAKKSLQIWLHDELKKHPGLYQKYRIYILHSLLKQIDQILEKNQYSKKIEINHSVALWGGSERVENLFYNFYYKAMGFISGPHVRCSISLKELIAMKKYGTLLLISRKTRMNALEKSLVDVECIKKSSLTPHEKGTLFHRLRSFCKKLNLDLSKVQNTKVLSNEEREELFSEASIQEEMKKNNLPLALVLLRRQKEFLRCNEIEKAIEIRDKMTEEHIKCLSTIKLLVFFLKRNDPRAKNMEEELFRMVSNLEAHLQPGIFTSICTEILPYEPKLSFAFAEEFIKNLEKFPKGQQDLGYLTLQIAPSYPDKAYEMIEKINEDSRIPILIDFLEILIKKKADPEKIRMIKDEITNLVKNEKDLDLRPMLLVQKFLEILITYDLKEAEEVARLAIGYTQFMKNERWKSLIFEVISKKFPNHSPDWENIKN